MAAFHFRIVTALAAPSVAAEFNEKLEACYARYGATSAITKPEADDPIHYLVVTREGRMLAGIRIHCRTEGRRLPFEAHFQDNALVAGELEARTPSGIAELAGLWSAPEIARTGIGGHVVGAAVAVAPALGLRHMCSFAHQFNRFTRQVGFEPDLRIGEHAYPDDRYRSTVNWCDVIEFATADPLVRERIKNLRRMAADASLGAPIALGFQPASIPPPIPLPIKRPAMSSISTKTRPFVTATTEPRTTRVAPDLIAVETSTPPDDVKELLSSWPSILGDVACVQGATVISLRNDAGDLLATVSVGSGVDTELASSYSREALARTHVLGNLGWSDGAVQFAPAALYLAVRRARIEGAAVVAAYVQDASRALERALDLRPLGIQASVDGRDACAQRVDLAADRAYASAVEVLGRDLDQKLFGDEIVETFERWLQDLYGRGFFRAARENRLSRAQYVNTISNMHQFVRWTTRLLGHAVAHCNGRALRDHFLGHLQGEVNHEIIIERDLAHLGEDVDFVVERMTASPGTRQFMAVQESLIGMHRDPILFLASPLVAEGVASHLTPEFLESLERSVSRFCPNEPRKAMVFFRSHVNTDGGDDGHWEMVLKVVRERLKTDHDLRSFLGVMQASMRSLTAAYDEFVADLEIFQHSRAESIGDDAMDVAAE